MHPMYMLLFLCFLRPVRLFVAELKSSHGGGFYSFLGCYGRTLFPREEAQQSIGGPSEYTRLTMHSTLFVPHDG
ncbi:uncharacterized protein J3D65DRAFT_637629 [Phyllosticta citribraziliensis]|uniref:Secreted protein n=1 Tax=Phyllosticta citribraziliensis TaxID=989973 RepID=A0ABR1L9S4_9PEZI